MIKSLLSDKQNKMIDEWLQKEVYPKVIIKQKKTLSSNDVSRIVTKELWDSNIPYEGVSGGGLTYHITPTNIGTVVTVSYDDYELDVTEYDMW